MIITKNLSNQSQNLKINRHKFLRFMAPAVVVFLATLLVIMNVSAATLIPKAFVYTEVQVNVPFSKIPWRQRNPILKTQPGLLAKTWLSGIHTNTIGGIYAFDTIENAKYFAFESFPKVGVKMNAALYVRIFDASVVEDASRKMHSPYFR